MGKDSPLILSIDTATRCSSVSLTQGTLSDGEVLANLSLSSNITHSRRLINAVDQLFRETSIGWPDLGGVAVGLGPGSFTGLRIGMATAKGFAAAADKRLLGVSTLDGLAFACTSDKTICAVIDARKKQVYRGKYRRSSSGKIERSGELQAVTPENLIDEINEPVILVGDGVYTYGKMWKKALGDLVEFAPSCLHQVSASVIGLLCGEKYLDGHFLDIDSASPVYVRASDAELSLIQKKKT